MQWNPEALLDRLGGDEELARQMAALFVDECPNMLDDVRRAVAGGSADDIRRVAHAFKGSVANFVADGPAAIALALEHAGRDERLADAPTLLARLEGAVAELIPELRIYGRGDLCAS
ncbi:MAG TPA: Hpt domain-containing protein [Vicinamibacterales bacterium]|nr:Hpt domain-containing protein [Vicinamibacterales bacterium]